MPEKIVVASDGGMASRAAMDWVIERARHVPVDVDVVTVEELDWLPVGADESVYRQKYDEALASAEKYLSGHYGISFVVTTLLAGEPADELIAAASNADWLVIGSTRRSGDVGALHGTLALRIAAKLGSRLVVVPTGYEPRRGSVVVGVDEDGSSDAAVKLAAHEALRAGCDLVLVHAWSLPAPFSILDGLVKTTYPRLEGLHRGLLRSAASQARTVAPRLKTSSLLRFGSPAAILNEAARDQNLLVIGHHHRSRLEYLFLGSVGHDLLMAAPAPIMVVPEP